MTHPRKKPITITISHIHISVSADVLSDPAVVLVCEGLDTVANVTVNGVTVGAVDNMFIRHVFDVKSVLKVRFNRCCDDRILIQ